MWICDAVHGAGLFILEFAWSEQVIIKNVFYTELYYQNTVGILGKIDPQQIEFVLCVFVHIMALQ